MTKKIVGSVRMNILKMMNKFCDFCSCKDHSTSSYHAKTSDNKLICDICFEYDVCTSGPNRNSNSPCDDMDCIHRPKLISDWIKC